MGCAVTARPNVDRFRAAAALLVVCIHTAPLACLGETADFALRTLARLAVPSFFAATGFFVLGNEFTPGGRSAHFPPRTARFLRKTALLYAAATLLYLPVQLYNGRLSADGALRALVWDGTFYHLWYLPAVLLGVLIVYALARLPRAACAGVCGALYCIGVFGDSWYGLAARVSALNSFYGTIFRHMDYTRTGLFFAPVFLLAGALPKPGRRACAAGFGASLALLYAEAFALRAAGWPRFDAMYFSLVPCTWFLFGLLAEKRGAPCRVLRTGATLVYLLHPMAILLVRGAAKVLGLRALFVENSLVHFLAVAAVSFTICIPAAYLYEKYVPRPPDTRKARAWAEIDLDAVAHNAAVLRAHLPPDCRLMAVVKADAYGHGAPRVAGRLWAAGVRSFAVATLEEGAALRQSGIGGEILILGWTDPARVPELLRWRLTQTVADAAHGAALDAAARCPLPVHIAVDTGMHRLGVPAGDTGALARLLALPHLRVTGLFTHLAAAENARDQNARQYTRAQLAAFFASVGALRARGCALPPLHVQASGGILNLPSVRCAAARPGLALYGEAGEAAEAALRPALALKARVVCVRHLAAGACAGYGCAFTARRETLLAAVSIGYADGWPRAAGEGRGAALLRGVRVPVVGRVCMDQLFLDATDAGAAVGDTVTLIGADQNARITAGQAAQAAGTIANELLSRLGARVARIYVQSDKI